MDVSYLTAKDIEKSVINLSQLVFEVTDDCNLSCVYCAFGDLYCDYDGREKKYLRLPDVKLLIDYLAKLWEDNLTEASIPETVIGFYGGEPLLNMPFIKDVIDYFDSLHLNRKFKYSLTTNAVLLDRYMSYLVEKNFALLISLDGDEYANSYRVNKAGDNPFKVVLSNILKLKENYPEYYKNHVHFNSVLHDRNDVETVMCFFKEKLSKMPELSELSITGLNLSKKEIFDRMFNSMSKSFHKSENYDQLSEEAFIQCPDIHDTLRYVQIESGNVFETVKQLLPSPSKGLVPTGTCIPFDKKMFVTVNGKILPCERVSHSYYLGKVTETELAFDFQSIVDKHNGYLKRVQKLCKTCAGIYRCQKCVYQIDDLESQSFFCNLHASHRDLDSYNNRCFKYLKTRKGLYRRILETI